MINLGMRFSLRDSFSSYAPVESVVGPCASFFKVRIPSLLDETTA